jgi:hypothetical protein
LNNQADLRMICDEIQCVSSLDFSFPNQEPMHMTKFSVD